MLHDWEKQYPGRTETLFSAIQNVVPSQLADTQLFDFINLHTTRSAVASEPDDTCALPSATPDTGVQYVSGFHIQ